MVPKLTFQLNLVPKLTLGAEVHRLVPKLICAEVTRAEHRLPPSELLQTLFCTKNESPRIMTLIVKRSTSYQKKHPVTNV